MVPVPQTQPGGAVTHPTYTPPLSLSAGLCVLAPSGTSTAYRCTLRRPLSVYLYVLVSLVTSVQERARADVHLASGAGCTEKAATPAPDVHRAPAAKCRSVRGPFSRGIGCPSLPAAEAQSMGRFRSISYPELCYNRGGPL